LITGRAIYAIALLAVALSVVLELFLPASARIIAIAAVVCGLATWIVPLILVAWSWKERPRSSLAAAGFFIRLAVVALVFSATGLWLALLSAVFVQDAEHAWRAIVLIAAFWLLVGTVLYVGDRRRRRARARTN
jgi:MFS family permease